MVGTNCKRLRFQLQFSGLPLYLQGARLATLSKAEAYTCSLSCFLSTFRRIRSTRLPDKRNPVKLNNPFSFPFRAISPTSRCSQLSTGGKKATWTLFKVCFCVLYPGYAFDVLLKTVRSDRFPIKHDVYKSSDLMVEESHLRVET